MAKFATLKDMEASSTGYLGRFGSPLDYRAAYDHQEGMHTMEGQDILMRTYADDHLHDAYNGATNNCGDFVMGVLRAGGLQPSGNSVLPTIPNFMSISPANDKRRFDPLTY